ncbi:hypothetical protein [Moraxella lacunata]
MLQFTSKICKFYKIIYVNPSLKYHNLLIIKWLFFFLVGANHIRP